MTNLNSVNQNLFSNKDITKSKIDDTTNVNTSWKNRSKTHRFSEAEVHSEAFDNKFLPSQRVSMDARRGMVLFN